MHAHQWISEHGKYRRSIAASALRKILQREKRHCTWCNKPVPKPRLFWCSDACQGEFFVRCRPQSASYEVEKRDKGICAICGIDTIEVQKAWRELQWATSHYRGFRRCPCGICLTLREHVDLTRTEADHIIPVVEGGGLCGLDGYRSLCVRCHKVETKKLAQRLAQARRDKQTTGRALPLFSKR